MQSPTPAPARHGRIHHIEGATERYEITVGNGGIEICGAAGAVVALCDIVGRCHHRSVATARESIPVVHGGIYVLRIGDEAMQKVVIRQ